MLVTFYLFIENSLDCVCEIVIPPPPLLRQQILNDARG